MIITFASAYDLEDISNQSDPLNDAFDLGVDAAVDFSAPGERDHDTINAIKTLRIHANLNKQPLVTQGQCKK